ncbi:MAG: hypothetical protein LAN62_13225 [Acidobacteriia bacterium]|nr:hypothetical protein [Terriglobia bacterium]
MRFGNLEIPGGLLVMPAFVLVVALLLLWSWYYYSKQASEMQTLAASRGWKFLGKDSPELRVWLEEADTDRDHSRNWRPENIILVEGPPDKVYLFNYTARSYGGGARGSTPENGTACLAERPHGQARELVMIYGRSPLLGELEKKLLDDMVEVGGPEFRQEFLVRSHRPDVAAATVTSGLQGVLLRQTSSLMWDRVWIAGRCVFVTVTMRLKPEEWDELLGITKRLRAALP